MAGSSQKGSDPYKRLFLWNCLYRPLKKCSTNIILEIKYARLLCVWHVQLIQYSFLLFFYRSRMGKYFLWSSPLVKVRKSALCASSTARPTLPFLARWCPCVNQHYHSVWALDIMKTDPNVRILSVLVLLDVDRYGAKCNLYLNSCNNWRGISPGVFEKWICIEFIITVIIIKFMGLNICGIRNLFEILKI